MFILKNLKILIMASLLVTGVGSVAATEPQENIHDRIERDILSLIPKNHFFPAAGIKSFLKGYSEADLELIYADFFELKESVFKNAEKSPQFLVTAGAPCAGKSTLLERILEKSKVKYAYTDPDRVCLFHMTRTYVDDLQNQRRNASEAYEHWRGASNFISNTLMAFGLSQGYAMALGSTMTSPKSYLAFQGARGYGYSIHIIHVSCPDSIRADSENKRRGGNVVQCTDEDFAAKGNMFYQRLGDYLTHADIMDLYYRGEMDTYVHAATKTGQDLHIFDGSAYAQIFKLHNAAQGEESWQRQWDAVSHK